MKLSTFVIAFGPPLVVLGTKTVMDPGWLKDFSLPACIAIGAVFGTMAAIAAKAWDPDDN